MTDCTGGFVFAVTVLTLSLRAWRLPRTLARIVVSRRGHTIIRRLPAGPAGGNTVRPYPMRSYVNAGCRPPAGVPSGAG
jgi:hypothetical protein